MSPILIAHRRISRHNNTMPYGSSDLSHLFLLTIAGLIVIAGVTLDFYLAFVWQRRPGPFRFPAEDEIRQRPFTLYHALQILFVTLLFALPVLFQKPDAPKPSEQALILGPLLYALTALLVTFVCMTTTGTTFRKAFSSEKCPAGQAIRKGLCFGLAAIPPVLLISQVMTVVTEACGYRTELQQVFDWLGGNDISPGTRVFMAVAAVILAPISEEVLFRGILFPSLLKGRTFLSAALISGFYFALIHFHAPSLLPLLALSIAFSAAYAATGSLLTTIVMHALFNTTSLLFYLVDKT